MLIVKVLLYNTKQLISDGRTKLKIWFLCAHMVDHFRPGHIKVIQSNITYHAFFSTLLWSSDSLYLFFFDWHILINAIIKKTQLTYAFSITKWYYSEQIINCVWSKWLTRMIKPAGATNVHKAYSAFEIQHLLKWSYVHG